MKKITTIFFLASMFLLQGCNEPLRTFELGIDVQANFDNDLVQVYIDREEVLNKRLKTLDVLGACLPDGKFLLTRSEGSHEIKVVINNTVTHTENFNLSANLYIGIQYMPQQNNVHLEYANQKFMYD